jgi:triacylglycerol lipase
MTRMRLAVAVVTSLAAGCNEGEFVGRGRDAGSTPTPWPTPPRSASPSPSPSPSATPRLGPPYPIVLAHGFFGFDDFAGIDFVDYFYGVHVHLAARGERHVFAPPVDPFNDSTARGAQLAAHVERILADTGRARVDLIGHSQGGLDARVVAATRPDLVASVTTIGTPHRGSGLIDIMLGAVADPRARDLADALTRLVGAPVWDAIDARTSIFAALEQLSTAGMEPFNARYRDAPGVAYYSLTGRTDLHDGGEVCRVPDAPPFIARLAGERDLVDPLFALIEPVVDGGLTDPYPNDGVVRAADARHGRFLGCIPADHLDEVGHLLGDAPGLGNAFDHRTFYADLVAWLRVQGH